MSFFGDAKRQPFIRAVVPSEHLPQKPSVYEHIDPETGRCFHLTIASRVTEDGESTRFFVTEFSPSGQIIGANDEVCEEPRLLQIELMAGPNDFLRAANGEGFAAERIVMVTVGPQMGIGFESIDAALDSITHSIDCNHRYSFFVPLEHCEASRLAKSRESLAPLIDLMSQIREWADRTT